MDERLKELLDEFLGERLNLLGVDARNENRHLYQEINTIGEKLMAVLSDEDRECFDMYCEKANEYKGLEVESYYKAGVKDVFLMLGHVLKQTLKD